LSAAPAFNCKRPPVQDQDRAASRPRRPHPRRRSSGARRRSLRFVAQCFPTEGSISSGTTATTLTSCWLVYESATSQEDQGSESNEEAWKPTADMVASSGPSQSALHAAKRNHHRDDRASLGQAPQGAGRISERGWQADRGSRRRSGQLVGVQRPRQGGPAAGLLQRKLARCPSETSAW